ncbi:uncharacterized protein LOC126898655 [Daktulosphaira vitifoliae]|uniref:uncharacterized protein LOC126898655 n=1 Tax=Daktulosphaira vitifoliae TaxID=58002 RepID=UPI0021AA9D89|nr:uncharacterized protein LOC126898655 [Daktulosphaira vitifoliae]XP_050528875.1 uncharacterized protein LOC126898655 [Daktulosphaira vitifoliae]
MCDLDVNCPNQASLACYINAIYRAMIMVSNPDFDSITEYIMKNYCNADKPTIMCVMNALLEKQALKIRTESCYELCDSVTTRDNEEPAQREDDLEIIVQDTECEQQASTCRDRQPVTEETSSQCDPKRQRSFTCVVCNQKCSCACELSKHRRQQGHNNKRRRHQ